MKRFLFVLCVLGPLLAGYACAEPYSYRFPEDLCTVEGISFSIFYSKEDHEWQATITDADPGCVCTEVPSVVGCTADWVEYNDGTAEAPVYRMENNVYVTATVRSIKTKAFQGCTSLTDFQLPAALENIENDAFNGCSALESVRYGGSPCMRERMTIGGRNEPLTDAAWTYALTRELILPQDVQRLDAEALAGTGAEVVLIPESCSSVAADAFDNCPGLRYIVNRSAVEIAAADGVTVLNGQAADA